MTETKNEAKVRMAVTPDMSKPTGVRVDVFCGACDSKLSRFDRTCPKCGTKVLK